MVRKAGEKQWKMLQSIISILAMVTPYSQSSMVMEVTFAFIVGLEVS